MYMTYVWLLATKSAGSTVFLYLITWCRGLVSGALCTDLWRLITVVLLEFGIIMTGVGGGEEEGGKVCAYHVVLAVDGLVHELLLAVACRFVNGPRNWVKDGPSHMPYLGIVDIYWYWTLMLLTLGNYNHSVDPVHYVPTDKINASIRIHIRIRRILKVKIRIRWMRIFTSFVTSLPPNITGPDPPVRTAYIVYERILLAHCAPWIC